MIHYAAVVYLLWRYSNLIEYTVYGVYYTTIYGRKAVAVSRDIGSGIYHLGQRLLTNKPENSEELEEEWVLCDFPVKTKSVKFTKKSPSYDRLENSPE